jgi:hypothetical protein
MGSDTMHCKIATAIFGILLLTSAPSFAQVDLSGQWDARQHSDWIDRQPGPDIADYTGLAINDAGRSVALSYTAAVLALTERGCLHYSENYITFAPHSLLIWSETDPSTGRIVSWNISAGGNDRDPMTIWMDGRPQPSENSFYPFSGFTTGEWEGGTLTTYTTHMKTGMLRRNGVPTSDKATMTMHFIRHGNLLTIISNVDDPVYLDEPEVVARTWELNPRGNTARLNPPCFPFTELPRLEAEGAVPHFLPEKNPDENTFAKTYNLPPEAAHGGGQTLYPEYRKKLTDYVAPSKCTRYCCGWIGGLVAADLPGSAPGLECVTNGSGIYAVDKPK